MDEETNDIKSGDQGEKLPASAGQLSNFMTKKELDLFRRQLPEAFLEDASEGLNQVQDRTQLDTVLKQLNHQLHQQLKSRKKHMGRRAPGDFSWTYWAILIILLLGVCAFLVIRMLLR